MMKITQKDVEHVAMLARLSINENELEVFTQQLNNILDYFEKIKKLDTSAVEPSTHAININNVFRDDRTGQSLALDAVIENSPERKDGFFKVPKIIGG